MKGSKGRLTSVRTMIRCRTCKVTRVRKAGKKEEEEGDVGDWRQEMVHEEESGMVVACRRTSKKWEGVLDRLKGTFAHTTQIKWV